MQYFVTNQCHADKNFTILKEVTILIDKVKKTMAPSLFGSQIYSIKYIICNFRNDSHFPLTGVAANMLSRIMRKPNFCPCENKGTNRLLFRFRYTDTAVPPKFQACSHLLQLQRPVCVRLVGNPEDRFSRVAAHLSFPFVDIGHSTDTECMEHFYATVGRLTAQHCHDYLHAFSRLPSLLTLDEVNTINSSDGQTGLKCRYFCL